MKKRQMHDYELGAVLRSPERARAWHAARLPDVHVCADIRHPEHPLGRFFPEKNLIEFSVIEIQKFPEDIQRFAIAHEIGHWLCVTSFPDDHPVRSESEDFADTFAKFFLRRGDGDVSGDPFDDILTPEMFSLLTELAEECSVAINSFPSRLWATSSRGSEKTGEN